MIYIIAVVLGAVIGFILRPVILSDSKAIKAKASEIISKAENIADTDKAKMQSEINKL